LKAITKKSSAKFSFIYLWWTENGGAQNFEAVSNDQGSNFFQVFVEMTCSKILELDNLSEGLRVQPVVEVFLASREDPKPIWPSFGLLLGSPNRDMIRLNKIEACTSVVSKRKL
jgi:hypothetical protein